PMTSPIDLAPPWIASRTSVRTSASSSGGGRYAARSAASCSSFSASSSRLPALICSAASCRHWIARLTTSTVSASLSSCPSSISRLRMSDSSVVSSSVRGRSRSRRATLRSERIRSFSASAIRLEPPFRGPARPRRAATAARASPPTGSTRRPIHLASAQHVQMHVVHRLPPRGTVVQDQTVPRACDPLLARHQSPHEHDAPDQLRIVFTQRVHGRHVPLRDHQHVRRRLWVDVPERERMLVLMHHLGRDLPGHDPAEDALRTRHRSLQRWFTVSPENSPAPALALAPALTPPNPLRPPPTGHTILRTPSRGGYRGMLSQIEQRVLRLLRNDPDPMVPLTRIHAALVAELGPRSGTYAQLHERLRRRPDLFLLLEP